MDTMNGKHQEGNVATSNDDSQQKQPLLPSHTMVSQLLMNCNRVYQKVEEHFGGFFAKYGKFVAGHAWKVLIVSIIVNVGFGIGMIKLDIDNDARKYLPSGTREEQDLNRMEKLFPYTDFENFNALRLTNNGPWLRIIVRSRSGSLLTRPMLEEVQSLMSTISNITVDVNYKGNITSYQLYDICAKMNNRCVVEGELFTDEEFLTAVDSDKVTYPEFSSSTLGTVSYASLLGGKKYDNECILQERPLGV
ncbi:uncharacterized protein LOC123554362 [Mercenaria mercenaria]|uniref:uncharacterized protein LOC123554362 n=1 Tax=Mercenaria mercenaria TaxID=6596 RepID=UPI00234EFD49|nr:uncharacterized protein LOC123554362 [Mercenaria mercenaria]